MNVLFLGIDEVLEIHRDQIQRYGGMRGVRDWGLLESAVAMPLTMFGGSYVHGDLCEMAAAYLFHIVKNHPFYDGNKRTGAVTAMVFLQLNGFDFRADEDAFEKLVRELAEDKVDKSAAARFLAANSS